MDKSMTDADREGRLIAHRILLEILLTEVAKSQENPEAFLATFEEYLQFQDHEEDPGVMPDMAFSIEAASAAEMQRMVESARARFKRGTD